MPNTNRITDWDRSTWENLADRLLQGAHRHSSPGKAKVAFPSQTHHDATSELEGFARSFLLASIRIAGAQGADTGLIRWYATALASGTQQNGPESWPPLRDHGQPTVEATAIALALHFTRPWLWSTLDDGTKHRLIYWLSGSTGSYGADNNHVLFGATIQAFLASVEAPFSMGEIEAALDRIEDWYAGDGWYSDGDGRRFDHYNAWTFHLYPFFILEMLGAGSCQESASAERRDLYRSRLRQFLDGYQHLFAASGSPLIQGRSLTYRWGVVAPFWMGEIQGVSPLPPGRTRRLASGAAKYFTDRGVGSDGVLSLGWWRESAGILQSYNAPGSPLWASKGFFGLLLPPSHKAWQADESELEVEQTNVTRVLSGPQWLVHSTHKDDIVRIANLGTGGHPRQDSPLYRRLAFSTASAPVQHAGLRDNDIYVPLQETTSLNRGPLGGVARPYGGSLRFLMDAAGRTLRVDYATTLLSNGIELRAARVKDCVDLPLTVSGYSLASDLPLHATVTHNFAAVERTDGLSSSIALVSAATERGALTGAADVGQADKSILGSRVMVPRIELSPAWGNEVKIGWLVALCGKPVDLTALVNTLDLQWAEDGVRVFGSVTRSMPWIRRNTWPADTIGQGVFGP
jgi:hypothetical protein